MRRAAGAALGLAGALCLSVPAEAQRATAARGPAQIATGEPLLAIVSLGSQRISVHGAAGEIARAPISSGREGFPTPTGIFSILQKNRHHESNIYSGAPMPYMQRLTWSGIALHEGQLPGYPASHGCIRMPSGFAAQMWEIGRIGMRVVVSPSDVAPVQIAHPGLPVPVLRPAEALPDDARRASPAAGLGLIGSALAATESGPVSPFRRAQLRRQQAADQLAAAKRSVQPAHTRALAASAEANRTIEALRAAERNLDAAIEERESQQEALATAQTEQAEGPILERIKAATLHHEAAQTAYDTLKALEVANSDAAFVAAREAREAREAVDFATEDVRAAARVLDPISIFVSRKERRVYLRQGFTPLHDEPIEIATPEQPLGTHVFTAIGGANDGAELRWVAVTLPNAPPPLDGEAGRYRRRGGEPVALRPVLPASSAQDALGRFELPEETRKLVGDRLWPGGSLIVSDDGISAETGKGTDFVVLTK